jgi:hypothetical protein
MVQVAVPMFRRMVHMDFRGPKGVPLDLGHFEPASVES